MQWKAALTIALVLLLLPGAVPVLGQLPEDPTTKPPPEAEIRIEFGDPSGSRTGPEQVLKRFVCPDPRCRYSTSIWGPAGGASSGRCPDPWGVHGGLGPVLLDLGRSADRFIYSHTSPTGATWSRPFHPNNTGDWDPNTGGVDGVDRVRLAVDWGKPLAVTDSVPDKLRFRVMPPGVLKTAAMAWIPPGSGEDAYFTDLQPTIGGQGIDLDNPTDNVPNNPILANPATCPTQRWVIRVCDINPPWGFVDAADRFRIFRDSPSTTWPPTEDWRTDQDTGGGTAVEGDLVSSAIGTTFTSRSEEIAFEFAPGFIGTAIPDNNNGPGGEDALDIVFYTYSNCVYLPYPQPGDWDPYVPKPAGGWQGTMTAGVRVSRLTDASTSEQGNSFEYHIRPGEVGLGRIDVQERVVTGPWPTGGTDRHWWRPFRPRAFPQALQRPAADDPRQFYAAIVQDDADDIDRDLRYANYIDRSLFSSLFSSRLEVAAGATDPFDPLMPMVLVTGMPGATTPPTDFTVTNRVSAPVLRCPFCGAVHPTTDEALHPQAPIPDGTGAGQVPHVNHNTGAGGTWGDAFADRCEFCGHALGQPNVEPAGTAIDYAERQPLRTYTPDVAAGEWVATPVGFSRVTATEDATQPAIPFEDVLFTRALLAGTTVLDVLPAAVMGTGHLSVRVPNYQPPSIDAGGGAHPYQGLVALFRPRDPAHEWFREPDSCTSPTGGEVVDYELRQSVTGAALRGGAGLPVTRSDVVNDGNGAWDAYYVCPDCGNKQGLLGYDLNADGDEDDANEHECRNEATGAAGSPPACPGHAFCPLHGSHFAQSFGGGQCPFWGSGTYPTEWNTVASAQPNDMMDQSNLTAEEYDVAEVQVSVGRMTGASVARTATRPVDFGKVMPGRTGGLSVPGNEVYPQAISRPGNVEAVSNEGNVPLGPVDMSLSTQLLRTETDEGAPLGREQQQDPVNARDVTVAGPPGGGLAMYDHANVQIATPVFGVMPPYAGDVTGTTVPYIAGTPAAPGPDYAQVGAGGVPVPSGTPPGEYAGDFVVQLGPTLVGRVPARVRVVETRMPLNNWLAMDVTPTGLLPLAAMPPATGARSPLVIDWTSNPPGTADVSQNIYEVAAPAWPANPNDIFYGEKNWPAPPPAQVTADPNPPPDLYYNQWPQMFFDPMNPADVWGAWHTRRKSGATGMWNSFVRYRHAGMGAPAALLDTKQNKGGLRGLILNANLSADGAANAGRPWFFWEAGEEGRQYVGMDPTMAVLGGGTIDPASVDDFPLALTNARRGSADPETYTYLDRGSGALWELRKPDANPFVYTKDPWVVETFWQDPVTSSTRSYLNVYYSAFLREHGNADILVSRFIPFADNAPAGAPTQMTDPQANYGKAPFWRISGGYMGRLVRPKSVLFTGSLGEPMTPDGSRQSFTSRHLDWVIDQWYPMPNDRDMDGYFNWLAANVPANRYSGQPHDPRIYVVLITNAAAGAPADQDNAGTWGLGPGNVEPLAWDPRDVNGNYYDQSTGLIRITPTNLPPDPMTGERPYVVLDPSSGAVRFSRHLYTQASPDDPTALFNTGNVPSLQDVEVWLDYQPYTFRLTTDGSQDDSPSVLFDPFHRITVFWRRMNGVTGGARLGATSFLYKTFSTAIQVDQPPITGGSLSVVTAGMPAPTQVWPEDGIVYWSLSDLQAAGVSFPAAVRVNYNGGIDEVHTLQGWSRESVVPLGTVVAEGPISVAQEWYVLNVPQPGGGTVPTSFVKYWLFWTSNRGAYDPAGGALAVTGSSDVYCTAVTPHPGTAVPE